MAKQVERPPEPYDNATTNVGRDRSCQQRNREARQGVIDKADRAYCYALAAENCLSIPSSPWYSHVRYRIHGLADRILDASFEMLYRTARELVA